MRAKILTILCCFISLHAKEFLYPVGYHSEQDTFFIMYQKTSTHLELWEWDPKTEYAQQVLLSRYSPAGFTMLPDHSGFSFIDNGMLKVKQPLKRSPRTIEYNAPLYNVEQVHWITSHTCYASGKYCDYFGIFHIDWDGCVQPLVWQDGCDYLYPQKIGTDLFFVKRSHEGDYSVAYTSYSMKRPQDDFSDSMLLYLENQPIIHEALPFETPIAFLKMVSDREGFVISYPEKLLQKNPAVPFNYYRLYRSDEGGWSKERLFSFTIPTALLVGADRLYESILPLLPYSCQAGIYFVDSSETSFLALYHFDPSSGIAKRIAEKNNQHFFGVQLYAHGVIYGGSMSGQIEMAEGVQMSLGTLS
ncbi:MAG TPA: hypothetical protein VI521_01615 [Candidatus Babeliales bacterium]|nr:hypothetical protein [Candidatus Babeliales bacterium]